MILNDKNGKKINPATIESQLDARDVIATFKHTITLPANQNIYAAGDVIANAVLSSFLDVAKAAGRQVMIIGTRIQTTEASALANKNFNLHIYNAAIPAIADNAAFVINDANTDMREGYINVPMGSGNRAKVGQNNTDQIALIPVTSNVYCILETVEGFTPSAASRVINIYLKCLIQ